MNNKNITPLKEIYNIVGKGFNFYSIDEKEQLLRYVNTELKHFDLNTIPQEYRILRDRLFLGENMDLTNKQETIDKYLEKVPQNEIFLGSIRIDPMKADRLSLDITHPKVISNHYLACKVKDDLIYYYFFTSNPKVNNLYNLFGNKDIIGRNGCQYISKYQGVLDSRYISEIKVLEKYNTHNIKVDSIVSVLKQGGYFDDNICYNNKYDSLLVDDTRLNKVKKNIDLIYSNIE